MKRSPVVYALFFLSGISALVYEIVWTRMLTLVFGHTMYSVSIVLAAFMAGLGFGSYLWGHAIDRMFSVEGAGHHDPLLVYGKIEILIAATAAILSLLFANFASVYSWLIIWIPNHTVWIEAVKGVLAFALMFVPATLMGATLPIVSKYYVTDNTKLDSQVGYLYAINTLGAALGCLLTGFVLIDHMGVLQTALAASGMSLIAGIGAIRAYQEEGGTADFAFPRPAWPGLEWSREAALWMGVSCISGFTALAYETLWTRLLVFSISSTVYSFSMMLAVFLLGIVLGSLLAVPVTKRCTDLRKPLIVFQAGIGLYVIFSLYRVEGFLSAPWNSYNLENPVSAFLRYFKDSAALMLVPTMLLGVTFPILTRMQTKDHSRIGRGTGQIYAFNTLGAILGSLIAGFFLLPCLGSQKSLEIIAAMNLLLAVFLFVSGPYLSAPVRRGTAVVMAGLIVFVMVALPKDLLKKFFMRDSAGRRDAAQLLYFSEGLTDTVAVFRDNYGILDPDAKRLITNGISMSAANKIATRYMKLFAHIPILLTDHPDEVLVICFGTGQTVGAAGIHPAVKSVDAVDLSPGVVESGRVFSKENHDVLNNPKVHIILQDGRNHLLNTRKRYDVITAEPPPPRTAFTVNLYTKDYYEQARRRLKPGGIFAQWIPLHSQSGKEVDMHFRTFKDVFPHAIAWMSVANEILIIGSDRPIELDFRKIVERMREPVTRAALADIEIPNAHAFLANIWFLDNAVEKLGAGQPVISDNRPRIEFYLGLPPVIGTDGLERIILNRSPFDAVADRIKNMSDAERGKFRDYYQAMDLYQRGVAGNNRKLLMEAISLADGNNLFRYHLQADRAQIARLEEQALGDLDDTQALLNLGHAHYQIGDYEQSLEYFEAARKKDPKSAIVDLYMGYDYLELGRLEEAKTAFQSAVKKDTRYLRNAMQELGFIDLLSKLEQDRHNTGLILSVAQFYNIKSDYRQSLKYSLEILEKDPLHEKALQSVIISYRGLGEPREVFAYGIQYETANPDDINFQYVMAEMHIKTLQCDKAVLRLEQILKKDDNFQNAPKLLEQCQKQLKAEEVSPDLHE